MHTQPMVVIDWPMSIVYGICTVGLGLMTFRSVQVGNQNWRTGSSPLLQGAGGGAASMITVALLVGFLRSPGHRGAGGHRPGGLIPHLCHARGGAASPGGPPPDDRRDRLLPAPRHPVLHHGREPDEFCRDHEPHLRLRPGPGGVAEGRAGPRQRGGLGDLCRDVRYGGGGCGRPRKHRDQGHAGPRLQRGHRRGDHRGLLDDRPHYPTVASLRDLRCYGQRLHREAVCGRRHPGAGDGPHHDDHGHLLRPYPRLAPGCEILGRRISGGPSSGRSCRCSPRSFW